MGDPLKDTAKELGDLALRSGARAAAGGAVGAATGNPGAAAAGAAGGAAMPVADEVVEAGKQVAGYVGARVEESDAERQAKIMSDAREIKANDPSVSGRDAIDRARRDNEPDPLTEAPD